MLFAGVLCLAAVPAFAATPTVAGTFCFKANYGGSQQTFDACVVLAAQQLDAAGTGIGSITYSDPNGSFVIQVSNAKIVGNTAYLAGQVLVPNSFGVAPGTWFYEVATNNGPTGTDTLGGSNFGTDPGGKMQADSAMAVPMPGIDTQTKNLPIINGDIQVGVIPTAKDECKDSGWKQLVNNSFVPFKNQGACVSFIETGK
jgi:hypothetical protein